MSKEELKKIIFEAFKEVEKGQGHGARECKALDDYASDEELTKARSEDVETHWWEYSNDIKEHAFDFALTYNNQQGKKFHLPALMTAVIDGFGQTADVSVYMELCSRIPGAEAPHRYSKEYLDYLKKFKVAEVVKYYNFNQEQIHAVAMYLLWLITDDPQGYSFYSSPEEIETEEKMFQDRLTVENANNSTLLLDEAVAIKNEENRILNDWFMLGNVDPYQNK